MNKTGSNSFHIEQVDNELHLKSSADSIAVQSVINIDQPYQLVMKNLQYLMGVLLFIPTPKKILLLGVGGGSMIHFLQHYLPESHITGIDFNAELISVAQKQMMLPPPDNKLTYIIQDAQQYIENTEEQFDLIIADIFEGNYSPAWLLEQTFLQKIKSLLSDEGAITFNLLISSEPFFKKFYQSLYKVFNSQTLCLEHEDYENILTYGVSTKGSKKSMAGHFDMAIDLESRYKLPFREMLSVIYNINPVDSGII